MYKELNLHIPTITEHEFLETIFTAIDMDVNGFLVPQFFLPATRQVVPNGVVVSTAIDSPNGMSTTSLRNHAIIDASRKNASAVDLTISTQFILSNKWDLIEDDIISNKKICDDKGLSFRVVCDYRLLSKQKIDALCSVLCSNYVEYLILSTGNRLDDWEDNLIYSKYIENKYPLSTISNGGFFAEKHFKAIKGFGIFGVRLNSVM
jgi:deoxyribose-phosphate aldolase